MSQELSLILLIILPLVLYTIWSYVKIKEKDRRFTLIISLIAVFFVVSVIFNFIPATHPSTCIPNNSFLDPTGLVNNIASNCKLLFCGQMVTEYTNPVFYAFSGLTIVMLMLYWLRKGYFQEKISKRIYKISLYVISLLLIYLTINGGFEIVFDLFYLIKQVGD